MDQRLTDLTAVQLTEAFRAGRTTARQIADAVVARAEALKSLNAYITPPGASFIAAAEAMDLPPTGGELYGPLAAVPVAVKDNIDTRDALTTAGAPGLKDWQPATDATVVECLRRAGALIAGKNNLHEMAGGMTSANPTFGCVANPYDGRCVPGGSSGGSAAAVAARIVPVALGTDTGGSVLNPAALCGIWGFRPTVGHVSTKGVVPLSATRDTVGWFARTPEDLVLLDGILSRKPQAPAGVSLKDLRVGVPRKFFYEQLEPDVAEAMVTALERLSRAGAVLVEADLPDVADASVFGGRMIAHEYPRELALYFVAHGSSRSVLDLYRAGTSPHGRAIVERLNAPEAEQAAAQYRRIMTEDLPRLQRAYADYFAANGVAAIITPAAQMTAKPLAPDDTVLVNGQPAKTIPAYTRFTAPLTTAQLPGLSVPVALSSEGLPVGALFVGPSGSDATLMGLALELGTVFDPLPPPKT